jgi:hypothetical protein
MISARVNGESSSPTAGVDISGSCRSRSLMLLPRNTHVEPPVGGGLAFLLPPLDRRVALLLFFR